MASTSIEVKIVRDSLGASTEKSGGIDKVNVSFFATAGVEVDSDVVDVTGETGDEGMAITSGARSPFLKYRNPPPAKNAAITKKIINLPVPLDLTTGDGMTTLST